MKPLHLNFVLSRDGYIRKDGKALIHLMIAYNGNRKPLSTGIHLLPKEWDKKKQRVTAKCSQQVNYNMLLDNMKQRARDFHIRESQKFAFFNVQHIANYIQGKSDSDFIEFCENHIEERINIDAPNTIKQKQVVLKYLKKYGKEIPFEHIDYAFKNRFESFLKRQHNSKYKTTKELLSNNYISSILTYLKGFTTAAIVAEKITKNPFEGVRIKQKKSKQKEGLTHNEIMEIYRIKEGRGDRLIAMDAFVFSCFAGGLRFSDIYPVWNEDKTAYLPTSGLRVKDIVKTKEGYAISKVSHKTRNSSGRLIDVPISIIDNILNGCAEKIVKRHLKGKKDNDFIFGTYDNSSYNEAIKYFVRTAKIDKEDITSHAARRSYITNMRNKGIPLHLIGMSTSHASEKTTESYIIKNNLGELLKKYAK